MKATKCFGLAAALVCLIGVNTPAEAQEPAADVTTLWNFLGIPQGLQKIQDNLVNRRGNFPQLERKPPLKAIADPANLEPEQPEVIKKAAQIKGAEDLAPQKIKAIKYLATMGCGCYEDVDAALLDALEDCTEDVRYAAAKALEEAAGDPCECCGGSGCCNAKTMTKLYELAYGQDENCCYKEPSEKVREAAKRALQACQLAVPPVAAMAPEIEEIPIELPEQAPGIEEGLRPELPPGIDVPLPLDGQGVQMRIRAVPSAESSSSVSNPAAARGLARTGSSGRVYRMVPQYEFGPPAPGFPRQSTSQQPRAAESVPHMAETFPRLDQIIVR